jgi:hypothetical protein
MTRRPSSKPLRGRGGALFGSAASTGRDRRKQSRPAGSTAVRNPLDGRAKLPWYLLIAVAIVASGIVPASGRTCMDSAPAVRAAHPGAWPTWRGDRHHKCWFAAMGRHSHVALRLPPPAVPLPPARPKKWTPYQVPVTPPELPAPPPAAEQEVEVASFADRFSAALAITPAFSTMGWSW